MSPYPEHDRDGGYCGTLTTADGQRLAVRVLPRSAYELALVLPALVTGQLGNGKGNPLALEYTGERGIVRALGEVTLEDEGIARYDILGRLQVEQRRAFVRIEVTQPVVIKPPGLVEKIETYAIDLSGSGMLVSDCDELPIGCVVTFLLDLDPGQEPIAGRARVVRNPGEGKRGMAFEEISEEDQERLVHFVFDRQRVAFAKTRHGAH